MAKVLITKHITPAQLKTIMDAELDYDIAIAVQFEISYDTNLVIGAIKNNNDWIFTSVNAVKSIHLILAKYQKKFEQKIYCVGDQAYNLLTQLGYFSVTKFESEKDMSDKIDWSESSTFTYFCNNNLKKFLPQKKEKIVAKIDKVEVYQSILKYPQIQDTGFSHIFFFSPLAVRSIFKKNPYLKKCHAICVGPATKKVVKDLGGQSCTVAKESNFKSMVEMLLNL